MKRFMSWLAILAMAVLLAAGCQKNGDNGVGTVEDDESIVQNMAQSEDEEYLYELGIDDGSEDNMYDGYSSFGGGLPKTTGPIDSLLRFGRLVQERFLRQLNIVRIAPDTIKVTATRVFAGQFVIFEAGEDTTGSRPIIIHRKPMRHAVQRIAVYARNLRDGGEPTDGRRGWHISAVSLGAGHSVPTATIRINQVTIRGENGDSLVITEPLNTLLNVPDDIPTFNPGQTVTVRVRLNNTTANPIDPLGNGSTETLLLHFGVNRHHHARRRFEFVGTDPVTGENIYQGTWTIRQEPFRVYHAEIDAIDNGTIYDSNANTFPYNSTTWGLPYRVVEGDR